MSSWEKFSNEIVEVRRNLRWILLVRRMPTLITMKEDETDSYLKNRRRVRSRIIKKEDYEPRRKQSQSPNKGSSGWLGLPERGNGRPSPEVSKLQLPCPSPT